MKSKMDYKSKINLEWTLYRAKYNLKIDLILIKNGPEMDLKAKNKKNRQMMILPSCLIKSDMKRNLGK